MLELSDKRHEVHVKYVFFSNTFDKTYYIRLEIDELVMLVWPWYTCSNSCNHISDRIFLIYNLFFFLVTAYSSIHDRSNGSPTPPSSLSTLSQAQQQQQQSGNSTATNNAQGQSSPVQQLSYMQMAASQQRNNSTNSNYLSNGHQLKEESNTGASSYTNLNGQQEDISVSLWRKEIDM